MRRTLVFRAGAELTCLALASAFALGCSSTVNLGDPPAAEEEPGTQNPPGRTLEPPLASPINATSGPEWGDDWEHLAPLLTNETLRASWAAAPDDLWLVGDHGTVLRWDGKSRAEPAHRGLSDATYRAIAASSTDDVWIAGGHAALHFNGSSWTSRLDLASYDVRLLVRAESNTYAALTTDGKVVTGGENKTWGSTPPPPASEGPVLDLVAGQDEFYALVGSGVYELHRGWSAKKIVSFTHAAFTADGAPAGTRATISAGALIGRDPSAFGFLFSYDFGADTSTPLRVLSTYESAQSGSAHPPIMLNSHGVDPLLARVDERRFFFKERAGTDDAFHYFDGSRWFRGTEQLPYHEVGTESALAAGVLGSGAPAILGRQGLLAELVPAPVDQSLKVARIAPFEATPWHFGVAADSSAWAVHELDDDHVAGVSFQLSTWRDDDAGWTSFAVPEGEWVTGLAPLSRDSAWIGLRERGNDSPRDKLVHFDGSAFDRFVQLDSPLRALSPDGEGGYFALLSGELRHVAADQSTSSVAIPPSSGLCSALLAPVPGHGTWLLHADCRLSFWDGASLASFASFPTLSQGKLSLSLWGASDSSLYVTDTSRGLLHFDGNAWKVLWESELGTSAVWGTDDRHVWVLEGQLQNSVLHAWDGAAMRLVSAAPFAYALRGDQDSMWLSGYDILMRLRPSSTPVP